MLHVHVLGRWNWVLLDVQHLTDTQRLNIDAVILTAMAKHPADRYQSAWEMGEDLRRGRQA